MASTVLTAAQFASAYGLTPATSGLVGAAATNTTYTTVGGDRWDWIAWKLYGDPTQISALITANPSLPIRSEFAAGVTVVGPLLPPSAPSSVGTPWNP